MPGLDGIRAIREIRSFNPTVPIIMVSGSGIEQSALDAVRMLQPEVDSIPRIILKFKPALAAGRVIAVFAEL